MKKLIALLTASVLIFGAAFAQEKQQTEVKENSKNGASMKFDKEVHDFGTVEEGPKVSYEFTFENTGDKPLIINKVQASCGCTTPIWPREPIAPGETAKIKAVYNTKGRPGRFNKAITITSNADTPTKVLHIKGTVQRVPEGGVPEKKPSIVNEEK